MCVFLKVSKYALYEHGSSFIKATNRRVEENPLLPLFLSFQSSSVPVYGWSLVNGKSMQRNFAALL